jgi:hypothetical protein
MDLLVEDIAVQTRFVLGAAGLLPVLLLCGPGSPPGLRAQLPAAGGQKPGASSQSPFATSEPGQRLEAQGQAQLDLLDVQKQQLEDQGAERIQELEELAAEQIEQVKRDANRQIEQLQRETKRQIAQVKQQVKRQVALLDAQKRLVAAQAGMRSPEPWPRFGTDNRPFPPLDHRPQTVVIEVQVAEVATRKDAGTADSTDKDLDVKGFNGPVASVEAKLRALQNKGLLGTVRRLQLTGTEGQPSTVLVGEAKPYTTGLTMTARGVVARSISYRNVGTQLKASARVGPENRIEVDLDLNDSRMVPNEGLTLGKDEAGKPVYAMEFVTSRLTGKLGVAAGQAVAAEGVQTTTKAGMGQTLVIVSARVVDANARVEAEEAAPQRPPRRFPRSNAPPDPDRNP